MFLIIPILYRIFIYILNDFFERQCAHLDNQIAIQWNNPPKCDPDVDFQLITSAFYIKEGQIFNIDYSWYLDFIQKLSKDNPEKNIDFDKLLENTVNYLNIHLRKIFLIIYSFSNESNSNLSKIIQIIISSLYIISWLYILIVNLPHLYLDPFFYSLWETSFKQNPFE